MLSALALIKYSLKSKRFYLKLFKINKIIFDLIKQLKKLKLIFFYKFDFTNNILIFFNYINNGIFIKDIVLLSKKTKIFYISEKSLLILLKYNPHAFYLFFSKKGLVSSWIFSLSDINLKTQNQSLILLSQLV